MNNIAVKTKVLFVDDDSLFCGQAQNFLATENYEVHTLCDGLEVMNTVEKLKPDILVLDLDLGIEDVDGRQLCVEVSNTEMYQQGKIGIILISGQYIRSDDELLGYNAGADNYLIKPFDMSQLCVRIEAVCRRLRGTTLKTPYTGELIIDYDRRSVHVKGKIITLTKLEFDLLAYLVKSEGAVCVKADLLEHVWGTIHVEEGAIAKCISLIRKQLSSATSHKYIENVFGVGYKFSPD